MNRKEVKSEIPLFTSETTGLLIAKPQYIIANHRIINRLLKREPTLATKITSVSSLQPFHSLQRRRNHLVHVIILVLTQAAAENHLVFLVRQRLVGGIQRTIAFVVHRIVGFIPRLPLGTVLPADHRLGCLKTSFSNSLRNSSNMCGSSCLVTYKVLSATQLKFLIHSPYKTFPNQDGQSHCEYMLVKFGNDVPDNCYLTFHEVF